MCNISRSQALKDFLTANVQNGLFQPGNTVYGHEQKHRNGTYKTYCVLYGMTMIYWLGYDTEQTIGFDIGYWENFQNLGAAQLFNMIKQQYKAIPTLPRITVDQAKVLARKGYLVSVHTIWGENDGHMAIVYPDLTPDWRTNALQIIQAGKYNMVNYEHQAYPLETCTGKLFWLWRPGKNMMINSPREYDRLYSIWYNWSVNNNAPKA